MSRSCTRSPSSVGRELDAAAPRRRPCRARRRWRRSDRHRTARRPPARRAVPRCAVHQRGQLVGQRTLGQPPLRRVGVLRRAPPRARRAGAATASSGTVPTIASSIWTQNWRNWYGDVLAGSSHTAPPTDLPNLAPSLLGHQRVRHRERLLTPSRRRISSTPATMLPH